MSETFLRLYRERVEQALRPHEDIYGPESPVVKMGRRLLAEAEAVDATLQAERVTTAQAASLTGWSEDTLQKYARAALAGEQLAAGWSGLVVERDGDAGPYLFVLKTIPQKAA